MKLSLVEEEPVVVTSGVDVAPDRLEVEVPLVDDEELLNINQLATHFRKKRYWVAEKLTGIEPAKIGKKGSKLFRLADVEDILSSGEVQGNATQKAEAQTRKLEAEASLKELEVERRTGEVIQVSDVEQGATELFRAMHNRLTFYCDDSALDVSKLTTRGAVALYQKEHINAILQELRDNPTNFITKHLDSEAS